MRKIYKNPFIVHLWGAQLNSHCLFFLTTKQQTVWEHGWSHFLYFGKEDDELIVLGICISYCRWSWMRIGLCGHDYSFYCSSLSGLLYPANTVHMERLAGILEAACSCSVCWCTWTRKPFCVVPCTSSVHLLIRSGREYWCQNLFQALASGCSFLSEWQIHKLTQNKKFLNQSRL